MDGILDVLNDLEINRKLSSEADKLFQPFIGTSVDMSFSLIESNTTYSTRLGEVYKGGKTILAKIVGTELECSILCAREPDPSKRIFPRNMIRLRAGLASPKARD